MGLYQHRFVDDTRIISFRYPNVGANSDAPVSDVVYITGASLTPTGRVYSNNPQLKSEKQFDGKYYNVYKNDSYWHFSSLSDCSIPSTSDGPSWYTKRLLSSRKLNPISNSGANGEAVLPPFDSIFKGFMFTA